VAVARFGEGCELGMYVVWHLGGMLFLGGIIHGRFSRVMGFMLDFLGTIRPLDIDQCTVR